MTRFKAYLSSLDRKKGLGTRLLTTSAPIMIILLLVLSSFVTLTVRAQAPSFSNGMSAALVIGQSNFTSLGNATTQSGLNQPRDLTFDSSGNLWVVDGLNNRILEFKSPFSTGMSASLVIGHPSFTIGGYNGAIQPTYGGLCTTINVTQTSLCNPSSIAFDSSGNMWVGDTGEDRVLEFTPPFSNGMSASLVIGQANFTTSGSDNCSPTRLCADSLEGPWGVAFDSSGNLWVGDSGNDRVLEFSPPFSNYMNASLVIGQTSFTYSSSAPTQSALSSSQYITFDSSGNLWVADTSDERILQFNAPFSNGMNASLVLGQPNFTSDIRLCNTCYPLESSIFDAVGIRFDSSGNLWDSDLLNSRVLQFNPPFSNYLNASLEIGRTNMSSFLASCHGICASSLVSPWNVAFDSSGNIWVADAGDNRVMEFGPAAAATTASQPSVTTSSLAQISTSSAQLTTAVTSSVSTASAVIQTSSSSSSSTSQAPASSLTNDAVILLVVPVVLVGAALLFLRRRSV